MVFKQILFNNSHHPFVFLKPGFDTAQFASTEDSVNSDIKLDENLVYAQLSFLSKVLK